MCAKKKKAAEEVMNEAYLALQQQADILMKEINELLSEREDKINKAVKEIDEKREGLVNKLFKIKKAMHSLDESKLESYNKGWGWKEKVKWTLRISDRLLPISAIASKINEKEESEVPDLTPVLRLTINRMENKGEIVRFKNENIISIHYGLPEWFLNGKLIKAYEYF